MDSPEVLRHLGGVDGKGAPEKKGEVACVRRAHMPIE